MQILIKKIWQEDKVSKNQKPYTSLSILTTNKQGEDVWLNGFGNSTTKLWKVGQTVELDLYEDEYNGKKTWKFREVPERNVWTEFDEIKRLLNLLITSKDLEKNLNKSENKEISVGDINF